MKSITFLIFIIFLTACTRNLPPEVSSLSEPTGVAPAATDSQSEPEALVVGDEVPDNEVVGQEEESFPAETSTETTNENASVENGLPLAARVNKQPIYLDTFEKQITQFEQTLIAQGTDLSSDEGQDRLTQVQRQVLDALIEQTILEQEASKLNITISDEDLEATAQENINQGQARFEAWLAENDLTYEEFKETLRFQLIANQLFEQVTADISESADQILLRQILVADEAIARDIIAQLKVGVSFIELAENHSIDESNRANGGTLGWFPQGAGLIPPEVEALAFTLQQNEVSGPIKTALGFHIIQLQEREAERPLKTEMLQALKQQQFTNWLLERRASSTIEKFVTF